jgi:hypothetical protein
MTCDSNSRTWRARKQLRRKPGILVGKIPGYAVKPGTGGRRERSAGGRKPCTTLELP